MKVDSKVARLSSAASSAAKRSRPNCDIFCIAETLESLESNGLNCKKVKRERFITSSVHPCLSYLVSDWLRSVANQFFILMSDYRQRHVSVKAEAPRKILNLLQISFSKAN